jgi:DNA-binding transcriptional LysR family regulator
MREINQRRLRYFFEVLTHGSIRRAADAINSAPSVITRQIGLLEEELGIKLFERGVNGAVPTEAAQHVLEYWRSCKAQQENMEEKLAELNSIQRGSLRLAVGEGFIDDLMDKVLPAFNSDYPNIKLNLNILPVNDIVTEVAEDISHVGLAFNPPKSAKVNFHLTSDLPLWLLVGREHPLASTTAPLVIADVLRYPIALMPSAFGIGRVIETIAYTEHLQLNAALTTNSVRALSRFVKNNKAVTFIGAHNAIDEAQSGELIALRVNHPLLTASKARILVRAGRTQTKAASKLIEFIRKHSSLFSKAK